MKKKLKNNRRVFISSSSKVRDENVKIPTSWISFERIVIVHEISFEKSSLGRSFQKSLYQKFILKYKNLVASHEITYEKSIGETLNSLTKDSCRNDHKDLFKASWRFSHEASSRGLSKKSYEEKNFCFKAIYEEYENEANTLSYRHMFKLCVKLRKEIEKL